jgi:hypothetical protein
MQQQIFLKQELSNTPETSKTLLFEAAIFGDPPVNGNWGLNMPLTAVEYV